MFGSARWYGRSLVRRQIAECESERALQNAYDTEDLVQRAQKRAIQRTVYATVVEEEVAVQETV